MPAPERNFSCRACGGTGLTYEGTGHRMAQYPWVERTCAVTCSCPAGKALAGGEAEAIAREVEAQRIADDLMAAASKADLMMEEEYD